MAGSQMVKKIIPKIGIGVDIVDISRFNTMNRRADSLFLNRIFTKAELEYCFSRPQFGQHLAARFAAKEATVKALESLKIRLSDWRDIKIKRSARGLPSVSLPVKYKLTSHVSLSHDGSVAIAFILLYQYD